MHACLIAEGSYPYVTGGVGKWAHDLISSIPEVEFTVAALWPGPGSFGEPRYPKPRNLREILHLYLMSGELRDGPLDARTGASLEEVSRALMNGEVLPLDAGRRPLPAGAYLKDGRTWERMCRLYRECAPRGISFQDYFWTWRATMLPVLRVLEAALPDCDVVHAVSTGYAGLLGSAVHRRTGAPLVLTEHGLYTRERAQELWDLSWIPGDGFAEERRIPNFFKEWWNRIFVSMEKTTYASADAVISLFEDTRKYQVAHGAPERRTRVIPNGIDWALFDEVRQRRRPSGRMHVGLVGRVVPIKDIRTFISACQLAAARMDRSKLQVSIIGPQDEDEEYARRCHEMVGLLDLSRCVTFTGRVDCRAYYETLDVVVLTSLSEGQPLSLLEALACGIPVVATDVGSCREILEGRPGPDRDLGPAGLIVRPADPEATADAVLRLLHDERLRREMGKAGRSRVDRYYRLEGVRQNYLDLYRSVIDGRD